MSLCEEDCQQNDWAKPNVNKDSSVRWHFWPKIIENEGKDKMKWKVKNLIQKLVGLKLIELNSGDEVIAEYSKFFMS